MEIVIKAIKKLNLKHIDDFCRIWTLGQNHTWTLKGGKKFFLSWRMWGSLLSEMDNFPDTNYLTYYMMFIEDARTQELKKKLESFEEIEKIEEGI
ncbi:MAG: hypothetical protein ACE5ES_00210 [Candidatus Nanoarchaeia archaeon]